MDRTQVEKARNPFGALLGRQLPFSVESEQALLGAMILDSEKIGDLTRTVIQNDFYLEKHQRIFAALVRLSATGKAIDPVTLLGALVQEGVYNEEGGAAYIRQLVESVPAVSNARDYAALVHDKALLRSLIYSIEEILDSAYLQNSDARELLEKAEETVFALGQKETRSDVSSILDVIQEFYLELKNLADNRENTKMIRSYFGGIDQKIVGMNPGDFILIGARPGMGKTTFALNIAAEVAKHRQDKAVVIFSLEMTKTQLVSRMLASEGLVDNHKLREANLADEDYSKLASAATVLNATRIFIDDTSEITTAEMRSKLRRIPDLGLVIVDYLQLMHSDRYRDNRVLEVADITRNLKLMAKELDCPIIACSQLSRMDKDRKRPQLTDLRDSGAIEQDADMVLFLHRDYYYDFQQQDKKNDAVCIIAKNRHGSTGDINLFFDGDHTRFFSRETGYDEAPAGQS